MDGLEKRKKISLPDNFWMKRTHLNDWLGVFEDTITNFI